MSLVFETIQTEGIAVLSYLIGDDSSGTAALVDPCADVERYVELARKKKVAITHIFETHIHADLVSGARELQHRLGGDAKIVVSVEGGPTYDFPHHGIEDGDRFEFGSLLVVARHTPGHTPEHMAYVLHEKERPDAPWGVLSGDSLGQHISKPTIYFAMAFSLGVELLNLKLRKAPGELSSGL